MKILGKWLGVAETVGPVMSIWVLPISCSPIPRSSIVRLTPQDLNDSQVKLLMLNFTNTVKERIGDHTKHIINDQVSQNDVHKYVLSPLQINSASTSVSTSDIWDGDANMLPFKPTSEDTAMEELDKFIGAQIPIDTKSGPAVVRIVSRK